MASISVCQCQFESVKTGIAITPEEACIRVLRGMDLTIEAILTDGKGRPVDISADAVTLKVYDKKGGALKLTKTAAAGTHLDGVNGCTSFDIAKTDIAETGTTSLSWVYEIRRVEDTGEERVHLTGPFVVDAPVGG